MTELQSFFSGKLYWYKNMDVNVRNNKLQSAIFCGFVKSKCNKQHCVFQDVHGRVFTLL
jgi:hypothetical protein